MNQRSVECEKCVRLSEGNGTAHGPGWRLCSEFLICRVSKQSPGTRNEKSSLLFLPNGVSKDPELLEWLWSWSQEQSVSILTFAIAQRSWSLVSTVLNWFFYASTCNIETLPLRLKVPWVAVSSRVCAEESLLSLRFRSLACFTKKIVPELIISLRVLGSSSSFMRSNRSLGPFR